MKTLAILAALALLSHTCGAIKVVDMEKPAPFKDEDTLAREAKWQINWNKGKNDAVKAESDQKDED